MTPPIASPSRPPSASPDPATLAPARLVDSDHPAVLAFAQAQAHARGSSDRECALALHNAVRDGFPYDPYHGDLSAHGMRASTVISNGHFWCVPKATLRVASDAAASGAGLLADAVREARP